MKHIWTVVLTYNGLEDTRKCLASLAAAAGAGHPILLVDNGSTDNTSEVIPSEFPWVRMLRIEKNAGPSSGYNGGIAFALEQGADGVLLLNNDTTTEPALIERLRAAADAYPEYGVIGPVINYMDEPTAVMTDGVRFNPRNAVYALFVREHVPLVKADPPAITDVDVVNGACMLIRAEVFRSIGMFDQQFFIYHDETDFCLRAARAGFRCGVIGEQHVWHKGSSTFKTTGKRFARYYDARNLVYLLRKHRGASHHGRSRVATSITCLRYLWYRYCHEQEDGHPDSADAVIEGLLDGLAGRQGPFVARKRALLPLLRSGLELVRARPYRVKAHV